MTTGQNTIHGVQRETLPIGLGDSDKYIGPTDVPNPLTINSNPDPVRHQRPLTDKERLRNAIDAVERVSGTRKQRRKSMPRFNRKAMEEEVREQKAILEEGPKSEETTRSNDMDEKIRQASDLIHASLDAYRNGNAEVAFNIFTLMAEIVAPPAVETASGEEPTDNLLNLSQVLASALLTERDEINAMVDEVSAEEAAVEAAKNAVERIRFASILKSGRGLGADVPASQEEVSAGPKEPVNEAIVHKYVTYLNASMGSTAFEEAFSALKEDNNAKQAEVVAVLSALLEAKVAPSTSRSDALARVLKLHNNLVTFKLKQRAMNGKSAS